MRRAAWLVLTGLSTAVALFSFRYVVRVGPVPPNVAANRFVWPWIAVHAGGAATALLVGPLQLLPGLRLRHPRIHRWLGRAYVAGCGVGGVTAMVLSTGTVAGPVAAAGFIVLDAYWLASTGIGTIAAVRGRHDVHRRWMTRSFALTVGAVTLRLYLPLSQVFGIDFLRAYRVIAWLAWVPNALLVELYLLGRTRRLGIVASRGTIEFPAEPGCRCAFR